MPKPKVLIDVFYLYVAQTGIKTYMLTICEQIQRHSNPTCEYIISPDYRKVLKSDFFRGKTKPWKNLLFQGLYFWRKQVVLPTLSYWWQSDILFSPDILSPLWGRGKKVSVVHDTFFWDSPDHYQKLWLKYYLFFLEKGLQHRGEIITITKFSRSRLEQLPPFQHIPIHVVYPASGLKQDKPFSPELKNGSYFLHVGVLEKRKNLGMLIEAFSILLQDHRFSEIKLVLIGQKGPRESLDDSSALESLVRHFHLEDKVIFKGHIAKEELCAYYGNALAYVFPSLNEGFGLPVLESFAFGIPVIVSRQGALMEVAGEAALVIEENTPEALSFAMRELAMDADLRCKLVEMGNIRIKAFSMEKFFLSLDQKLKDITHE
ncbi:glycosyltransferase family 4 protein [Pleomorphovibrio marinus]|uniref:glycosyltransferase family 4 protein n=1 Tax=Pleomorphovibrio marinus TaxID=2164132 RepID=UPI000E0AC5DF|nr:glycosyltransferase family 1 protein [Pleomorphovibrio marinus]